MPHTRLGVYLSYLLRHHPEDLSLHMDVHGWVGVDELMAQVNAAGKFSLTLPILLEVVQTDNKGRFRLDLDARRIKACQGHSIPWVEPELTFLEPPAFLYHGTTRKAYASILDSGAILKMKRHAVHMQADELKAWSSACRWDGQVPVVLKIDAQAMSADGFSFGVTENEVWCTDRVPAAYIAAVLTQRP